MKKWPLIILPAALALGLLLKRNPVEAPRQDLKPTPTPEMKATPTPVPEPVPEEPAQSPPPAEPEKNPSELMRERLDAYLKARGRDVGSLLGAWALTDDPAFLEEAALKFPNSPLVMISQMELGDPGKQGDLATRLMSVDPNNALPVFLAMSAYWREGNLAGAQEMAERLVDLEEFSDYHSQRVAAIEEAAIVSGLSGIEASATALRRVGDADQVLQRIMESREFLFAEMESPAPGTDPAAIGESLLRLGAQLLEPTPSGNVARQLYGAQILLDTLERLPKSGLQIDGDILGKTVEQWKQQANTLKQEAPALRNQVNQTQWLAKAAPWQQQEFLRLYREQGEQNAMRWVKTFLPPTR